MYVELRPHVGKKERKFNKGSQISCVTVITRKEKVDQCNGFILDKESNLTWQCKPIVPAIFELGLSPLQCPFVVFAHSI